MISQVANANYALTPYSEEAGALAMVPGSHRLCRKPHGNEMQLGGDNGNPNAVPVIVKIINIRTVEQCRQ